MDSSFLTDFLLLSSQTFFVKENGVDLAVINAVEAITSCLRSEEEFCINIPEQGQSLRTLGL
jgi:hypothetical protein